MRKVLDVLVLGIKLIFKVLGIAMKVLWVPLEVLSAIGSVGSHAHMNSNRQNEMLAQFKVDDIKRKLK